LVQTSASSKLRRESALFPEDESAIEIEDDKEWTLGRRLLRFL
jgi:hypothetical protein